MRIAFKIVLVLSALAMMAFGAMDVLMGMDLLGAGLPAMMSGALAIATGLAAIAFVMAATPPRKWTVVALAIVLLLLRIGRFPGSGFPQWEQASWVIFVAIVLLPPLLVGLIGLTSPVQESGRRNSDGATPR